jgi:hypothetical protein
MFFLIQLVTIFFLCYFGTVAIYARFILAAGAFIRILTFYLTYLILSWDLYSEIALKLPFLC